MNTAPRILMCRPDHYGIHYEINPWMSVAAGANLDQARQQWMSLRSTLENLGATIEEVEPVAGLPDQVFTANAGLIYGTTAVVSRFRYGVRQGESGPFREWFRANGFDTIDLPDGRWFEGAGDALFCGDTLFAGYRHRSDAASHQWVGQRLGVEVLPLELMDPRFYHLDTCFCPLAAGEAIYYPGAFDDYGRAVLKDRIPRLIEADGAEATSFCCNAVVLGRNVVLNEGAPRLVASLREAGFTAHELPLSEFLKAGGSAKCLTLRLDGEDAAGWRSGAELSSHLRRELGQDA
jgi:N-dimethylarginine dimethylaminohydrolase